MSTKAHVLMSNIGDIEAYQETSEPQTAFFGKDEMTKLQKLVQDAICTFTVRKIDLMKAGSDNPQVQIEIARIEGQINALSELHKTICGVYFVF